MAFLTDADRERVRGAIAAAERRTVGEFVAVVAPRADHYLDVALFFAALVGLAVALLEPWWGGWGRPSALAAGLATDVLLTGLLCLAPRLRVALTPDPIRRARCRALARRSFVSRDVARTEARTGVLLFVAVDERWVEVIADAGINAQVAPDAWHGVVAGFVARVHERRVADGFVEAATAVGALLATHFPRPADDANELPDHLIEL